MEKVYHWLILMKTYKWVKNSLTKHLIKIVLVIKQILVSNSQSV